MSQAMVYTFRLFGANAGKTMKVNGHQFQEGELRIPLTGSVAPTFTRLMGYYGAYAKGTIEYEEAEKKYGSSEANPSGEQGPSAEVDSEVRQDGSRSASEASDDGQGAGSSEADGAGSDSTGDGHGYAGQPRFEEPETWPQPQEPHSVGSEDIKSAILQLDPTDKSHWVATGAHKGKPKLAAVETIYGKAGLSRNDLEAALPGWTQEQALKAQTPDEPKDTEVEF